jgi:hypothetical protein
MIFIFNIENKGRDFYIETFRNNKELFEDILNSIITLQNEVNIFQEDGEIYISQNGNNTLLSEITLNEVTKSNIKRVINDLNISSIEKYSTYIEFIFNSKRNQYSIAYTVDNNQLIGYTNEVYLEDNWYYCDIALE